jgi:hypothetical protein
MNIAECKKRHGEVRPAVFQAAYGEYGRGRKSVYLYPRKNAPGFMWCIWRDTIKEDREIALAGTTALPLERASKVALAKFFAYCRSIKRR